MHICNVSKIMFAASSPFPAWKVHNLYSSLRALSYPLLFSLKYKVKDNERLFL